MGDAEAFVKRKSEGCCYENIEFLGYQALDLQGPTTGNP